MKFINLHNQAFKFYKMLEDTKFSQMDRKTSLVYSIKYTKHSTHIFPWNEDISDVKIVMEYVE